MLILHNPVSTSESVSNKVGNATDGAVGDETLLHQAQHLATSTIDYAKGVVGIGGAKPATDAHDAVHNAQGEHGSHTLGELTTEARQLAAKALAAAQTAVAGSGDKVKAAAGDVQHTTETGKPTGYVEKARDLAASALGTAQSYVAVAEKKVDETTSSTTGSTSTTTDDLKKTASGLADDANKAAKDVSSTAADKADELKAQAKTA